MSQATIYGIKNCDTMKKAFKWLDQNKIAYTFHDYKKEGFEENTITQAIKTHGWESVINRRGTTWRQLPDDVKATMTAESALDIAQENPSIIKRPLLKFKNKTHLGFKDEQYKEFFEQL